MLRSTAKVSDMVLPVILSESLLNAIVAGARRGHDIVARSHNEEEGFDASTFGFNRYRLSWFWIAEMLKDVPDAMITYPDQSMHVRWGRFDIGFYNGGSGADWDPAAFDFSATARRAQAGVLNQMSFPGMEPEPGELVQLLVTYSANPTNGCEAVHIGAPITDPTTGQTSWAWIEPIWLHAGPPRPDRARTGTYEGFRDLEVADLDVDLRDVSSGHAADGTGS